MENGRSIEAKRWHAISFGVAVLCGVVIAGCVASFDRGGRKSVVGEDALPLKKGWTGTYVGKVEWTVGTNISAADIDWVMEVVEAVKSERAEAAVVRGFLKDLAWFEPGNETQFTVIAKEGNRVYQFACEDEAGARLKAKQIVDEGVSAEAEVWLDLPLARGKRWAFDPERTDLWYCWLVEEESLRTVAVGGIAPREKARTWKVVYRTAPDHQVFAIAEGIGIVGYEFEHHGTVARAHVVLTGIRN